MLLGDAFMARPVLLNVSIHNLGGERNYHVGEQIAGRGWDG
jgi:hypothetical protein